MNPPWASSRPAMLLAQVGGEGERCVGPLGLQYHLSVPEALDNLAEADLAYLEMVRAKSGLHHRTAGGACARAHARAHAHAHACSCART
eukprot:1982118-Pleurochrysis_carterae.AAC.1